MSSSKRWLLALALIATMLAIAWPRRSGAALVTAATSGGAVAERGRAVAQFQPDEMPHGCVVCPLWSSVSAQ